MNQLVLNNLLISVLMNVTGVIHVDNLFWNSARSFFNLVACIYLDGSLEEAVLVPMLAITSLPLSTTNVAELIAAAASKSVNENRR